MGLLSERVVVLTGAAGGIGRETARLLSRAGAHLVLNDSAVALDGSPEPSSGLEELVEELRASGTQAHGVSADASSGEAMADLAKRTVDRFGTIDAWINNAGILRDRPLLKMDDDDFDVVIQNCLRSAFVGMRAAARVMATKGGGSIINTVSLAGLRGNFGQANYAAATAGVLGLTRTGSIELQKHSIRVNAIAPLAKTRMTEALPIFEHVDSMGPEHVAPVHVYLSSELSVGRTGMVISVAGGRLSTFHLEESTGHFKESDSGVWSPEEIATELATTRRR